MKLLLIIAIASLLLAMLKMPLVYYTILRIVVFTICVASLCLEHWATHKFSVWYILVGLVAVVFNPFVPIFLDIRAPWMYIDLASVFIFSAKLFCVPKLAEDKDYL